MTFKPTVAIMPGSTSAKPYEYAYTNTPGASKKKINILPSPSTSPSVHIPNATFAQFLKTRADDPTKSFGTKDKLKYRYVEFVNAKGILNNIKAFLNLGGLGYFFAGKVNKSNIKALAQESKFYHQCCKVQEFYQKFNKKPDTANFKGLKEAYEAVLALAEDKSPIQHNQINDILKNHFANGSSVGAAVLKHIATSGLTSNGGFTEESIIDTISGQQFLAGIHAKYAEGYRGTISDDEFAVINGMKRREIIQQPEIQQILSGEGATSIFMSYARAYTEQLQGKGALALNMRLVDSLTDGEVLKGQVDRKVNGYNNLILNLIQNPEKIVLMGDLPPGFQTKEFVDELDNIALAYSKYQTGVARLPELDLAFAEAKQAQEKVDKELEANLGKTRTCTLGELEVVFGDNPNRGLPGVNEYTKYMEIKRELVQALAQKNQEINDKTIELQKLVGDAGSLTATEKEIAESVTAKKLELETCAKNLTEAQSKIGSAVKEAVKLKGKEANHQAVAKFAAAYELHTNTQKAYEKLQQQHEEVISLVAAAKTELKRLEKPTPKDKHQLIIDRDGISKELQHLTTTAGLVLTHNQIAQIYNDDHTNGLEAFRIIDEQLYRLRNEKVQSSSLTDAQEGFYEETMSQIKDSSENLSKFGFVIDQRSQQLGKFSFIGFNKDYKKTIEKVLQDQAPLSANIIKALQVVAAPIEIVNMAMNLSPSSHKEAKLPISLDSIDKQNLDLNVPIKRKEIVVPFEEEMTLFMGQEENEFSKKPELWNILG